MDKQVFEEYAKSFKDLSNANLKFHDITTMNKLFGETSNLLTMAAAMCDSVDDLIALVNLQIERAEEQLRKKEELGKRLDGVLADLHGNSSKVTN